MILENANEEDILTALDELFREYSTNKTSGEHFGDYFVRTRQQSFTEEVSDA
jgi:sulfite reductase beta subunit-like hemoprotein